jgi:hypothetical protein
VSGTFHPEEHQFTSQEIEYIDKIDWLWQQLSALQRCKIVYSVANGSLKQGSDKHCFIAEAISANVVKAPLRNYSILERVSRFVRSIFYDGPSYDHVLDRKITDEDRKILNDIYYARIGKKEHQYQRATRLVRACLTNLLIRY